MREKLLKKYLEFKNKKITMKQALKFILNLFITITMIYLISIILVAFQSVMPVKYKYLLLAVGMFYLPFVLYKMHLKNKENLLVLNISLGINIILSIMASIFEYQEYKQMIVGFSKLFPFSIVLFLVTYSIQNFISKDLTDKIFKWGFVVILLVTGIFLMV